MRSPHQTDHIQLNTRLCEACGRCVEACHHGALGMVAFLFHKHAKVRDADRCRGCLRCVTACEHGAIVALRPRPPRRAPKSDGVPAADPDP